MGKSLQLQPSRTSSIRSSLIFGLSLCAMARVESRMGSLSRAEHLVTKAKRVAANASGDLDHEAQLSTPERHHLGKMVEQLEASIGGLDPLWVPNLRTRSTNDLGLRSTMPRQRDLIN